MSLPLSLGLALGYGADLVLADPRRGHPVAGFGRLATALERRLYADDTGAGVRYVGLAVGVPTLAALALENAVRARPPLYVVLVAAATWAALGGRSLAREGREMSRRLEAGDLPGARERLSHLCARDATDLDAGALARASVESLTENTADAVIAPLFWGAVAGLPGVIAYRCVNTLDAMVGYRSARYRRFGRAAARLDDALNVLPSRLVSLLTVALAPVVGGRPRDAARAWCRDAPAHPSPNAGPVEASAAGALGVRLGGSNVYGDIVEDRGTLGDGRAVEVADIARTLRLTGAVGAVGLACAVLLALGRGRG